MITPKTLIAEIVEKWPKLAEVLVMDYGFHCIGCYGATMETIEDGAKVHGMNQKEIKAMIANLNQLAKKK